MAKESTKTTDERMAGKADGPKRSRREDHPHALSIREIVAGGGKGCKGFGWVGVL